ncbi:MAG: hypothetical protein WA192_02290 [Candidatus Acidiferrales bacterium]
MKRWRIFLITSLLLVCSGVAARAQSQDPAPQRQDAPPDAASRGTRFLVSLQTRISTREDPAGKRFLARTLDPIATADGTVLPAGADVRGHIDKVQPAGKVGRARLWLTFDDIRTSSGWSPLVAELIDAPGVHSIRVLYDREGEIQATSSKQEDAAFAAAEAAFVGAEPGFAARNKKDAAMGAAISAATAFMITSGLGQELTLPQNMKLELVLERPLYFSRL